MIATVSQTLLFRIMRLRILEYVESPNHQAGSEAVPKRVKSIDEYTIAKCEVGWAHTLFLDGKFRSIIVSIRMKSI